MKKLSNIDREGFQIINQGYEEDLRHLRDEITKEVKAEYSDRLMQKNENNTINRWMAETANHYTSQEQKDKAKEDSEKGIETSDQQINNEIQSEINSRFQEKSRILESKVFEEYGGFWA